MPWTRAERVMLGLSALLGALYFTTTGNLFLTFCLDASEASTDAGGSWSLFLCAVCSGALVGGLSGAYALATHERRLEDPFVSPGVGAVLVPALAECALLAHVTLLSTLADVSRLAAWRALAEFGAAMLLTTFCWLPMAGTRTLYFGIATGVFATAARERTPRWMFASGLALVLGVALSIASARITPPSATVLIPAAWVGGALGAQR